jgi:hypothetical protein
VFGGFVPVPQVVPVLDNRVHFMRRRASVVVVGEEGTGAALCGHEDGGHGFLIFRAAYGALPRTCYGKTARDGLFVGIRGVHVAACGGCKQYLFAVWIAGLSPVGRIYGFIGDTQEIYGYILMGAGLGDVFAV